MHVASSLVRDTISWVQPQRRKGIRCKLETMFLFLVCPCNKSGCWRCWWTFFEARPKNIFHFCIPLGRHVVQTCAITPPKCQNIVWNKKLLMATLEPHRPTYCFQQVSHFTVKTHFHGQARARKADEPRCLATVAQQLRIIALEAKTRASSWQGGGGTSKWNHEILASLIPG